MRAYILVVLTTLSVGCAARPDVTRPASDVFDTLHEHIAHERDRGLAFAFVEAAAQPAELPLPVEPDAAPVDDAARQEAAPDAQSLPAPGVAVMLHVNEAAAVFQLPRALLLAVIEIESAGNPRALSRRGALGLMQLMPATAERMGVVDARAARDNILGGARYLRQLVDQFDGDLSLALAAYNAGPATVRRYGGVPPYRETQWYVRVVLERYQSIARQVS
ncbi:MAG: hypothetical protein RL701_2374 [Pseudomonadota bacterium]|jgi:soluble lytic murein transglycosylase-like protein